MTCYLNTKINFNRTWDILKWCSKTLFNPFGQCSGKRENFEIDGVVKIHIYQHAWGKKRLLKVNFTIPLIDLHVRQIYFVKDGAYQTKQNSLNQKSLRQIQIHLPKMLHDFFLLEMSNANVSIFFLTKKILMVRSYQDQCGPVLCCQGFFTKFLVVVGGGGLAFGDTFQSLSGDGVRWGGLAWGTESDEGVLENCLLRPRMPLTAKLEQILVFWA